MRFLLFLLLLAPVLAQTPARSPGGSFRLIKSLSGPTGKVVGSQFVFDSVRNRFVYPQDGSFVVYFEWEGPAGSHSLTGNWKGPDGRTLSVSPDITMQTQGGPFSAYWQYSLTSGLPSGTWALEVRIDGEPAGSHPFEVLIPAPAAPVIAAPAVEPLKENRSLDDLFKLRGSLVWVHKLDSMGRRLDTSTGFVLEKGQVATAFQSVDSASSLEIEFEGGRKVKTNELWFYNRMEDIASIKVDTGTAPALTRTGPAKVMVGDRLIVFNVESNARVIGGVDITGKRELPAFGARIQLSPAPALEAVGGPLLMPSGEVVGIIGGSVVPAARFSRRDSNSSPGLWSKFSAPAAATPISRIPVVDSGTAVTLSMLRERGALTPELALMPALMYGSTTAQMPKTLSAPVPRDQSEFSRKDPAVWVYSMWQQKDKLDKGMISAVVYDSQNRPRVRVPPMKLRIPHEVPLRHAFSFSPAGLDPGVYRVDVQFNDSPIWRTFVTITD